MLARTTTALLLALCVSCGRSGEAHESEGPPPTLDVPADHSYAGPSLAEFELTNVRGEAVALTDLLGQPVVLDFVFTTCAGPCPTMSANMSRLQDELEGSEALLVSVSVDPERDTVEVLGAYAEAYGADSDRWWFLTGGEDQMAALAASVYLSAVPDDSPDALIGYQVAHDTKFVVVDARGVVRGYYDGRSEDGLLAAAARVRFLAEGE